MLLSGDEAKQCVEGIIHEETQLSENGIDLTVNGVAIPKASTDLDFGGGEENIGEVKQLDPQKRNQDDKYGWWNLDEGLYIIDLNEDIEVDEGTGVVVPLSRLTNGGSFHAPIFFTGRLDSEPLLRVNSAGLNLKENARISRLHVWR